MKNKVDDDKLAAWKTAALYNLIHAAVAVSRPERSSSKALFNVGICLFSGSIYGLVLFKLKVLGPVTPLGGLVLIAAWIQAARE